jgi:hypothetical protein
LRVRNPVLVVLSNANCGLGTTGDSSGNISWGFSREGAILFPEVEINYDVGSPDAIELQITYRNSDVPSENDPRISCDC